MPNNHQRKYISKLLIGFVTVTAGIFSILYACFEKAQISDWYFWAIVASFLICTGLYLLLTAMVHKTKADFRKKQQKLDKNKPFLEDQL